MRHEDNRKLHEAGDLVEQPGIRFKYQPLVRSGRFEILPDDLFAAVLIQYDTSLAEVFQIFGCVGDADFAR